MAWTFGGFVGNSRGIIQNPAGVDCGLRRSEVHGRCRGYACMHAGDQPDCFVACACACACAPTPAVAGGAGAGTVLPPPLEMSLRSISHVAIMSGSGGFLSFAVVADCYSSAVTKDWDLGSDSKTLQPHSPSFNYSASA